MIQRADTVGVFQIESRAQMSMLPRLKPKEFYDLVIEVAIVRPGPIQGKMVHPYLRRRNGQEPVEYPSEAVRERAEKTLGVPLVSGAGHEARRRGGGFHPRRSRPAAARDGRLEADRRHRTVRAETDRRACWPTATREEFARNLFRQIEGFGSYGFPESHAASFALLVYVSAWIKCHHPAVFLAALLNSQPMGFYGPSQLVTDARAHGVEVRPVDVNQSDCDCTLERRDEDGTLAVRLGWSTVKGLVASARPRRWSASAEPGRSRSYGDFVARTGLTTAVLSRLAAADAFRSLGLDAPAGLLDVAGRDPDLSHCSPTFADEAPPPLAAAFAGGGSHP